MNKILYAFIASLVLLVSCTPDDSDVMYADSDKYTSKQMRSPKRGVCFNNLYEADFTVMNAGISWTYNWAAAGYNATLADVAAKTKIEYFPMIWNGGGEAQIRKYKQEHPECMYILAFNEPNLTDQANMTPAQAAAKWAPVKTLAQELNMKIVAPAMNYGTLAEYGDPIKWLDEFFAQPGVSIDDVDALALHCYMNVPSALKSYVERFRKYNKPVWMTEFCAWEGEVSVDKQREYMCDVLNYFESDPFIERYSWFKYDGSTTANPRYGLRPAGNYKGELSELGKIYVYLSSLDKELHYTHNQVIPGEHYSNCNASEAVETSKFTSGPQLKVSSDVTGILEVTNFGLPKWAEYKIAPVVKGDYHLIIRYASSGDSKIKISINDQEIRELDLPKTGSYTNWETITTPVVPLKAGKQTIRITPSKGMISLNWWRYKRER
ncbi:hypothetical protein FACS189413_14620 [Bacteroidia bacterium]|nr:hypothetical protein FACS189413_14620 [Bacteroidia bacterium]